MLEAFTKPISLIVAALSVVGFLIGLGTSGLMVAFSVVGVFYFLAAPILTIIAFWPPHEQSWFFRVFSVLMVACLVAWPFEVVLAFHEDLTQVGVFSLFGMGSVLGVIGLLAVLFAVNYKEDHQACPECMNVIHARARVCHYCGFRFQPPVLQPLAKK